jgi:transcription antitermination factor NusG
MLATKDFACYEPHWEERRAYSDRLVTVPRAAFPGYTFCRFDLSQRFEVLSTSGVQHIVGRGAIPEPIDESLIFSLQRAFANPRQVAPADYFQGGERVRVAVGPLAGVTGVMMRSKGDHRLVISVELLQRSVSVEVEASAVMPDPRPSQYRHL